MCLSLLTNHLGHLILQTLPALTESWVDRIGEKEENFEGPKLLLQAMTHGLAISDANGIFSLPVTALIFLGYLLAVDDRQQRAFEGGNRRAPLLVHALSFLPRFPPQPFRRPVQPYPRKREALRLNATWDRNPHAAASRRLEVVALPPDCLLDHCWGFGTKDNCHGWAATGRDQRRKRVMKWGGQFGKLHRTVVLWSSDKEISRGRRMRGRVPTELLCRYLLRSGV